MISALLGLASALGLGAADFMARFSTRELGAPLTYGVVLLIGAVGATLWAVADGTPLTWSASGCMIAVVHGVCVAVMCILLYIGIARGPIAIVAPIVAAHPALVLAVNVLTGVRPSALQWAAMSAVMAGGILIARSAVFTPAAAVGGTSRTTLLIAFGACVAYAAIVLTAQAATPLIGEFQTMLIGRWTGLVFIAGVLLIQRARLRIPSNWIPYVGLQGGLDSLGYFAFLAGANSAAPYITMVVASAFSVVTVALAKLILHEPISKLQWTAIALIAAGTAVLSVS
jgi:drug/metabolite transporter (DMT)-like permease